ncbi:hypothetical protein MMC21_005836 [Puttea exsequens]|nr:hypothetical protein [Puttea exsequens]
MLFHLLSQHLDSSCLVALSDVIRAVYGSEANEGLNFVLITACARYWDKISMDDESNEAMRDYADFTIDFLQASRKRFENELDEMRKYKDSKEEFLDERIHEDAERTAQIELMNFTMNKGYNRFKRESGIAGRAA